MTKTESFLSLLSLLSVSLISSSAFAYLDPNIGSMLLQGLVAGVAVVSVTLKMYWYRIKAFFTGEKLDPEEDLLAGLDIEPEDKTD